MSEHYNRAASSHKQNTSSLFKNTRITDSPPPPPPATARGHHPQGGNLPRRQHEVARRPRTTVYDPFRVQYTTPVPITISEVYIPIRTIATY